MEQQEHFTEASLSNDAASHVAGNPGGTAFNFLYDPHEEIDYLKRKISLLQAQLDCFEEHQSQSLLKQKQYSQRFESLLERLPCGVIMLDGKGVIEHINDYAIRLFDMIAVGESWISVIQREFSPREDDGHEISLRNGRRLKLDTASLDDASGQIVILLDLTETRNLQTQLSDQKRLVEMGRMMASLAHQIRTPLSTAMLYGSHFSEPVLDKSKRLRYAEKLHNRLECINQQIIDMLVYVRGRVDVNQNIAVPALFSDLKSYCRDISSVCGSKLVVDSSVTNGIIRCNKLALIGALGNLVQNAFQSRENAVEVKITSIVNGEGHIVLTITDNGPGIPSELQEKIFTPFFTTKTIGTGLGLPIVKTVIDAHSGEIRLDKTYKDGCRFTINLPLFSKCDSEEEVYHA